MRSADSALFESLSGQMLRRSATESVRRSGDTIKPGLNRPGFSTFTATSAGGKEDEGTAFKAKTADGKVVPIIMRGEAGKGGSAEVILPKLGRFKLTIAQASKLRGEISSYDAEDVPGLVMRIRDGSKKEESVDTVALSALLEKSPPGWSGTVKAMKKHMPTDKAFALAWSMHKKGATPHYKAEPSTKSEGEPVKKKKYRTEAEGDQDDTDFIADPKELQTSIEKKLGLANMRCPGDVLDIITSMYDKGDVPAAVYAAACGMARSEQSMSAASAKVLNRLSAADVAEALLKGVKATGSASIKDYEGWWKNEIGKIAPDRGQPSKNNITRSNEREVQPYIDSLATEEEEIDVVFDSSVDGEVDSQPIGSGALSSFQVIGIESGYRVPTEMQGNEDLSRESVVDRAAAASSIRDGSLRINNTSTVMRNAPDLPGVNNRIRPGSYTAEALDALDFKTRLRLAEAYDKLVGNAPDMSHDELVDADAYRSMLIARSTPNGSTTPIASVAKLGKVTVGDMDAAFEAASEDD